ncbi:hypothetical protein Tco_1102874 [Tanacetum coccineum]
MGYIGSNNQRVYHRRRPTLGLLILPYVSPFSPTIKRTARMSILPIEPNLAERAQISAIILDEYQLDPTTQREEALTKWSEFGALLPETVLTVCTTCLRGQLHAILEDMDCYPNSCLDELEAFMIFYYASEEARQKRKEALEEVSNWLHSQLRCDSCCMHSRRNTRRIQFFPKQNATIRIRAVMMKASVGTEGAVGLKPDRLTKLESQFGISKLFLRGDESILLLATAR